MKRVIIPLLLIATVFAASVQPQLDAQQPALNLLADTSQELILKSKKSKGESSPFAAFLLGCVLIPFALVMLWKNEKKQVTYAKVIGLAKKECISIKIEEPFDEHEFYLVSGSGRAVNSESIDDHDFGATVKDSYRLIRTVEMYQWVRKERRVERNGERHTEVYYESQWSSSPISNDHHNMEHQNPSARWPYTSQTTEANNVKLGGFRLTPEQVSRLGDKKIEYNWLDKGAQAIEKTGSKMDEQGFEPFVYRDGYFYSSAVKSQNQSVHIGQYRVRFDYCKCDQASVVAQQIKDHDGNWTFRKWNPYKKNVPYGVSTDAESDSENSSLVFCCVCIVVDKCMNTMFEEVVNHFVDGIETAQTYFEKQAANLEKAKLLRPVGVVLTILGLYLLFAPIIAFLSFVPLAGMLLSSVASFAAFLFALIVGMTVSCLTIGIAWVFFRPMVGIPLLGLTGVGLYLIFFA